ncbi:phytanoyl-CoA dioxygenase domain-containing protein 1 homolog [Neocloeon triangulifer]|uniref:phytanoyl-CoA dioxygenase domain-containing protein 1 homolog n=1 Tax=Neocloeon triangulifer TaxID=2078957 RepID=UPI00286FA1CD|nr:phytanoyl-CoA dioxygenase domain-containing protein 1 homolog [Neocloeon triangulifer]
MKGSSILEEFQTDGFVVLEDFLSEDEILKLRHAGEALATDMPDSVTIGQFSTVDNLPQNKDLYFLESGDKIRYFLETGAVGENGKLTVEKGRALNKVGHALHWLHPDFKEITFSNKIKDVCRAIGLEEPAIAQSMYIYKNPGVGSEVCAHQDATFLYTEPMKLVGFWFALDDATMQNGCLKFAPGSHCGGVHRRYVRKNDPNSDELVGYDSPALTYPQSNFRSVPVKRGSCVLIHGLVVHQSDPNRSSNPRHAYTFHVIERKNCVYSEENWLQPSEELPFPLLYNN